MKNFREAWAATVERKQSLLCVGIDASEAGQRAKLSIPAGWVGAELYRGRTYWRAFSANQRARQRWLSSAEVACGRSVSGSIDKIERIISSSGTSSADAISSARYVAMCGSS